MSKKYSRLLYFGQATWGSTSRQRFDALKGMFKDAYLVDSRRVFPDKKSGRSFFISVQGRLGVGPIIKSAERILAQEVYRFKPDMIWIDGGFFISNETLEIIRHKFNCKIIHYTPDSLFSPGMSNRCMSGAISAYDEVVTTKEQDLSTYEKLGARHVIFSLQGFDPDIHRPVSLTADEKQEFGCDVSFVGQCMKDRANSLDYLSRSLKLNLRIYGTDWDSRSVPARLKPLFHGPAIGHDYAKVVCASKITLGFLNREVRDTFTTRTFEIPACGGFLLAERTSIHQKLFAEDSEAAFFSSDEELKDKVNFYLTNENVRERIAKAGHLKVMTAGYTWEKLMEKIISEIDK
ncbi:MAG: glycosyltransferase [Elusimicrobiota bacterium]